MPHYKDGTEAKVGDLVKGVGYNVRGSDGKPKVIVGEVVYVQPASPSCNIQVAHALMTDMPDSFKPPDHNHYQERGYLHRRSDPDGHTLGYVMIKPNIEYGQCDQFEKIG